MIMMLKSYGRIYLIYELSKEEKKKPYNRLLAGELDRTVRVGNNQIKQIIYLQEKYVLSDLFIFYLIFLL